MRSFINVKLDGTNRSVNKLYRAYNKYYFEGKLENIPVRFGKNRKARAIAEFNTEFTADYIDGSHMYRTEKEIILNPMLKKFNRLTCIALLHEINHVAYGPDHGKIFKKGIDRLIKIGAYRDLL